MHAAKRHLFVTRCVLSEATLLDRANHSGDGTIGQLSAQRVLRLRRPPHLHRAPFRHPCGNAYWWSVLLAVIWERAGGDLPDGHPRRL